MKTLKEVKEYCLKHCNFSGICDCEFACNNRGCLLSDEIPRGWNIPDEPEMQSTDSIIPDDNAKCSEHLMPTVNVYITVNNWDDSVSKEVDENE